MITLGVCAMKKKVQSKLMKEILRKKIDIIEMWECLERHWSVQLVIFRNGRRSTPSSVFTPMVSLSDGLSEEIIASRVLSIK
jgi:hypothetical protein